MWKSAFAVSWCCSLSIFSNLNLFFSKNLGTLWEDLAKTVEGEDEIEIGQVDCGANKSVCSKVDIHSYPTFKIFYDGEEVAKYKGNDLTCNLLLLNLKYS